MRKLQKEFLSPIKVVLKIGFQLLTRFFLRCIRSQTWRAEISFLLKFLKGGNITLSLRLNPSFFLRGVFMVDEKQNLDVLTESLRSITLKIMMCTDAINAEMKRHESELKRLNKIMVNLHAEHIKINDSISCAKSL